MAVEREKKQPGVMLYFEIIPALEQMTAEERGELFLFILKYARDKTEPSTANTAIKMLWAILKERIDHDSDRYAEICLERKYNAYARKQKKAEREFLSFEEWRERILDE